MHRNIDIEREGQTVPQIAEARHILMSGFYFLQKNHISHYNCVYADKITL